MPGADAQLVIEQAKEGSHDALRVLVEGHMEQAYDLACGFVNDHDSGGIFVFPPCQPFATLRSLTRSQIYLPPQVLACPFS